MTKDLLLALDQGTQSVRAMIFTGEGGLLAKSQVHITPYFSKQPGWAEQDCDYFWANLCRACQNLWAAHPDLRDRVAGMSLTTQRSVTVCLDKGMMPLRPAVSWLDQRRTANYPRLPLPLDLGIRAAGQKQAIHYFQSKAECNWLAADQPEVWRSTAYFFFLSGYLTYKLTWPSRRCRRQPSRLRALRQ